MSERFSDEVLQRACRVRFDTESALLGGDDVAAGLTPEITAAGLAAMRAVLEGHLAERFAADAQGDGVSAAEAVVRGVLSGVDRDGGRVMADTELRIPIAQVTADRLKVRVTLKGYHWWRVRMVLGGWLLLAASWLISGEIVVEVE